jgi:hypothetical protein
MTMANKLKACTTCGGQLATSAVACPHCGAKQKKKTGFVTWLMVAFLVFAFWIGISASNRTPQVFACPATDPLLIQLRGEHIEAQADFTAKAQRLNASGTCVLEGDFGQAHQKFYFAVYSDGNKNNARFIRMTREELKQ